MEEFFAQTRRQGNSTVITVPVQIAENLKLEPGTEIYASVRILTEEQKEEIEKEKEERVMLHNYPNAATGSLFFVHKKKKYKIAELTRLFFDRRKIRFGVVEIPPSGEIPEAPLTDRIAGAVTRGRFLTSGFSLIEMDEPHIKAKWVMNALDGYCHIIIHTKEGDILLENPHLDGLENKNPLQDKKIQTFRFWKQNPI